MTKVTIRTRQVDGTKALPVIRLENDDLSEFLDYTSSVRGAPPQLSGMDKGEEMEHHLQVVLNQSQNKELHISLAAIPTPEVYPCETISNKELSHFSNCKAVSTRKITSFDEEEQIDYDLDEQDSAWLKQSNLNISSEMFETLIAKFERNCTNKALMLEEAKSILRDYSAQVVITVYDYWLNKRVLTAKPLLLCIKAEKLDKPSNTPVDPFVAFRKRMEKMTTRRNRRVDETSFEKMLRLKQQMDGLKELVTRMVKREDTKLRLLNISHSIFIERLRMKDYDRTKQTECELIIKRSPQLNVGELSSFDSGNMVKRKRTFSRSSLSKTHNLSPILAQHSDPNPDGYYKFRRLSNSNYLASRKVSAHSTSSSIKVHLTGFEHSAIQSRLNQTRFRSGRCNRLCLDTVNNRINSGTSHQIDNVHFHLKPKDSCMDLCTPKDRYATSVSLQTLFLQTSTNGLLPLSNHDIQDVTPAVSCASRTISSNPDIMHNSSTYPSSPIDVHCKIKSTQCQENPPLTMNNLAPSYLRTTTPVHSTQNNNIHDVVVDEASGKLCNFSPPKSMLVQRVSNSSSKVANGMHGNGYRFPAACLNSLTTNLLKFPNNNQQNGGAFRVNRAPTNHIRYSLPLPEFKSQKADIRQNWHGSSPVVVNNIDDLA